MPSPTNENYLKTLHHLREEGADPVPLGQLARALSLTPGTVTVMVKRLGEQGLVHYQPRRGVRLSSLGEREALQVIRRHRLIESFLANVMGLAWHEVHEEAEILEHVVSDRLIERMSAMLDDPAYDPHGAPIPDRHGHSPDTRRVPLAEATPGHYQVVHLLDDDPRFLSYARTHGLTPGDRLNLQRHDPMADTLTLQTTEQEEPTQIGLRAAAQILVTVQEG